MFSYENGLVVSALMYVYYIINLLISINSQLERNLNKVGERISWLSLRAKPMNAGDLHPPSWKIVGKFVFIAIFQGIFVLLSWVNVLINVMVMAYGISKDRGVPTEIREFRWKLKNQDLSFDEIIRETMKVKGIAPELFESAKAEMIESLRDKGLMKGDTILNQSDKATGDPIYGAAVDLLNSVLDNPDEPFFSKISAEEREELRSGFLASVRNALATENPVATVRNRFGNLICMVANFNVIIATGEYLMFEGISGELRSRVSEIAEKDEALKEYFNGLTIPPNTPTEMIQELTNCVYVRNLQMTTYGAVRIALGDYDEDRTKDWARPFIISQQIFMEWNYRKSLGMPSNIPGDDKDAPFDYERPFEPSFYKALMHSRWPEIISAGHKHPRLIWEQEWESMIGEPSPFTGVEL